MCVRVFFSCIVLAEAVRKDNDAFLESEKQAQEQIMQQREEDLTQLSETVGILGQIGLTVCEKRAHVVFC